MISTETKLQLKFYEFAVLQDLFNGKEELKQDCIV